MPKLSTGSPELPTELIVVILSIAATHHRPTAALFCLVSKWVRDVVDPILYRVVRFRSAPDPALLSSPNFCKNVRHLAITGVVGAHNASQSRVFPKLRSFAIDSFISSGEYRRFISSETHFEELHVTEGCFYWLRQKVAFPQLRRLHLTDPSGPDILDFVTVVEMPYLTHVALSISMDSTVFDRTLSFLKESAVRLLQRKHKQLKLLFVRLLTDSTCTTTWPKAFTEGITKDTRFIVKDVFVETGITNMLDEWEQNALRGESIWDDALIRTDLDSTDGNVE